MRWIGYLFGLGGTLLCLGVAAYAFGYLYQDINVHNPFIMKFASGGLSGPFHFMFGALALTVVPLQLSRRLRGRWPTLHRSIGGVYCGAVFLSGFAGLSMAPAAQTGSITGLGFAVLACIWIATTALALGAAMRKDFAAHRAWMLRSVALTTSAVTLRIFLGVGIGGLQIPFDQVYQFAAWGSWILNLALMELYLRWPGGKRWASARSAA